MLIRIVKMTFQEAAVDDFLSFISGQSSKIRAFEGCQFLQILQEQGNPAVVMTLSHWQSADALERYRHSALFKSVWAKTKIHFTEKPEAWSMNSLETHV